ncbi:MAG: hypothetical protein E6X86_17430, partial [Clostridium butyricum]|nr:hypothetical protein [Clostridium butyricum]
MLVQYLHIPNSNTAEIIIATYINFPPNNSSNPNSNSIIFISISLKNAAPADIKPRIIENYDGKDIVLNEALNVITYVKDSPELEEFKGDDLIVTDGTTLLGSADK